MGTIVDSLFSLLLGWVRALSNGVWNLINSGSGLSLLGRIWLPLALVLLLLGLAGDFIVWMIRWRPYRPWVQRMRKRMHIEETQRMAPEARDTQRQEAVKAPEWLPDTADLQPETPITQAPAFSREEAEAMEDRAGLVSDADLGEYPGMRYSPEPVDFARGQTQRYAAVAEDEQARYARELEEYQIKQAKYEQDLARWQREEEEKAQSRYAQELEEYNTKRARYELDLAAWEREHPEEKQNPAPVSAEDLGEEENEGRHRRRRTGDA